MRSLECPKCHSDDVKRSRRKFWERLILPLLDAHVHRCRDCKRRFWVGAQWNRLVFASIALVFVGGMIVTMVLLKQARDQPTTEPAAEPAPRQNRARPRRFSPPPPGLPPLSQVPRPKDDPPPTGSGTSR